MSDFDGAMVTEPWVLDVDGRKLVCGDIRSFCPWTVGLKDYLRYFVSNEVASSMLLT